MYISNELRSKLIISTLLNTGSVEVIGSSPIRSTSSKYLISRGLTNQKSPSTSSKNLKKMHF